jgi:hypothetical protein
VNVKWENLLLFPFFGTIAFPLLALLPAALFGAMYFYRRRTSSLTAALLWGAYALYESLMKARVLCSGECNIRVDLLLVIPLLWIAAIVAVVQFFRKRRSDGAA